ncbi:MAG TPA: histidine kinase [Solimonas sp.]|nr:histidine kinase [Solimonas sp.]
MERISPQASHHQLSLIPNFCRGQSILVLAFTMELVAIVFTLASGVHGAEALERLTLLSLYLQWIGLCSAAALCWSRRWLILARPGVVFFFCWGLLVLIVMVLADVSYYVAHLLEWDITRSAESRVEFILRHTCVTAIVAMLLLRYFWVRHQWRMQVRAEGESRYQALNARIRPHFLFNALNSLAALIQIQPDDAEHMVEDLSDLFRASLEKRGQVGPLADEVALCNAYLRIEKLRLGDKIVIDWDIPDRLLSWPMPMLVVQPLIENAVHHGVSKLAGQGFVRVAAREIFGRLVVEVTNPLPADDTAKTHGNRVAVDNIAQRLNLIYGDNARLELGRDLRLEGGVFRARLILPRELKKETEGE